MPIHWSVMNNLNKKKGIALLQCCFSWPSLSQRKRVSLYEQRAKCSCFDVFFLSVNGNCFSRCRRFHLIVVFFEEEKERGLQIRLRSLLVSLAED
jgi:hypothetical protein